MSKEINIDSNVAIALSLILINVIFLIYVGYDWYSNFQFDPASQNTEEAGYAFKWTAFVLGLLLIALYKVRRNEKIKSSRQDNPAIATQIENSPVNTSVNILLIALGLFFGVGIIIAMFYVLLFMYGTPG